MSTGENEREGSRNWAEQGHRASRLPRAEETGQDPLGTEARGGRVGRGGRPAWLLQDRGPVNHSLHSSMLHPSLIDGNQLMT